MFDTGSSFSFIRRDVLDNCKALGLPYTLETTQESCLMANGKPCVASEVAVLEVRIQSSSWKFQFFILDNCPIPCILGVNFLRMAKVRIDFVAR